MSNTLYQKVITLKNYDWYDNWWELKELIEYQYILHY